MVRRSLLKPSFFTKVMLICMLALSVGTAIWFISIAHRVGSGSQSLGNYAVALGIFFIVGLVGNRAFALCSVVLTEQGVSQRSLFSAKQFLRRKELLWTDITDVAAKPGAFLLSGRGCNIEVATSVFDDANAVIEFVRIRLPSISQARRG